MTLTTHDVASELGIDDKTARRFLRSVVPDHEASHKWALQETEMPKLKLLYLVQKLGTERAIEKLEAA
jgi:hypothetical protein